MLFGIIKIELSIFTELFLNESGNFTIVRNNYKLSLTPTNHLSYNCFQIVLFIFTHKILEAATFDDLTKMIEIFLKLF